MIHDNFRLLVSGGGAFHPAALDAGLRSRLPRPVRWYCGFLALGGDAQSGPAPFHRFEAGFSAIMREFGSDACRTLDFFEGEAKSPLVPNVLLRIALLFETPLREWVPFSPVAVQHWNCAKQPLSNRGGTAFKCARVDTRPFAMKSKQKSKPSTRGRSSSHRIRLSGPEFSISITLRGLAWLGGASGITAMAMRFVHWLLP